MPKQRVLAAEPFRQNNKNSYTRALGSFGDAEYMLLRQSAFPDTYTKRDVLMQADSDRLLEWDYKHTDEAFLRRPGAGTGKIMRMEVWSPYAPGDEIRTFLIDVMKADPKINWTGFRIMGSVHKQTQYPVWHFELFAKHPKSATATYSGENAPNVSVNGWRGPRASAEQFRAARMMGLPESMAATIDPRQAELMRFNMYW